VAPASKASLFLAITAPFDLTLYEATTAAGGGQYEGGRAGPPAALRLEEAELALAAK